MCIIVSKSVKTPMPSQKTLYRCWRSNPDGAGIVIQTEGKLIVRKGLMEWEQFLNCWRGLMAYYGENCRYLFHFRISTDGGVKRNLTHPFVVSERDSELLALRPNNPQWVIINNGIIPQYSGLNTEYSDTALYVKEIAKRVKKNARYLTYYKNWIKMRDEIGGSRLAIVGRNNFQLIGSWVQGEGDEKGLWFSHPLYRVNVQSVIPKKTKKTPVYNYGFGTYNPYQKFNW